MPYGNDYVLRLKSGTIIGTALYNQEGNGLTIAEVVGEGVAPGDILYEKNDGKYWKAKANAAATMPAVALALETKNANDYCKMLVMGFYRQDTWAWTVGGLLYVDAANAGLMVQAAPGSGNQKQVVGYAFSATKIFFNPCYWFEQVP